MSDIAFALPCSDNGTIIFSKSNANNAVLYGISAALSVLSLILLRLIIFSSSVSFGNLKADITSSNESLSSFAKRPESSIILLANTKAESLISQPSDHF